MSATFNTTDARYIPAGTRLAVRDSKGEARWYTTKKDVEFTVDPVTVKCPMGTGLDVWTIASQGFESFFRADVVRTRVSKERASALAGLRPCLLIYDIPDVANIPNPSGWMSRIAVRVNLSCWVIPEGSIPYTRLNTLTEAGATWHVVRFDASEAPKLIDMAVTSMRKELTAKIEGAEATRAAIEAELAAAEANPDTDIVAMQKRATQRAEQVQKRVKELIDNLTAAAGVFGINTAVLGMGGVAAAADAIRTGMVQRAAAFAEAARLVKQTAASGSTAMAAAVEADAVPAGVVADFIEENGGDASALRAAFEDTQVEGQGEASLEYSLTGEDTDGE